MAVRASTMRSSRDIPVFLLPLTLIAKPGPCVLATRASSHCTYRTGSAMRLLLIPVRQTLHSLRPGADNGRSCLWTLGA